jgi:hypothetical protein
VGEDEVASEARRLLVLSPSLLRKLTGVECGEAAFILGQYGHRLQQAINHEQGKVTWTEEAIKAIIAPRISQYSGISYEERRLQAIRDNTAACKYDAIRVHAKIRIDRLSFLAAKAADMAKSLMSLNATKRGRNNNE